MGVQSVILLPPPAGAAERCEARAARAEDESEDSPERERGAAGGQTGKHSTAAVTQQDGTSPAHKAEM